MTTGGPHLTNPLPPAAVLGIGAVTPMGRDLPTIAKRLSEPVEPAPLLRVSDDLLADPTVSRGLRRADRFVRMAAIAALDAWTQAQNACAGVPMERVGLSSPPAWVHMAGASSSSTAFSIAATPTPFPPISPIRSMAWRHPISPDFWTFAARRSPQPILNPASSRPCFRLNAGSIPAPAPAFFSARSKSSAKS